MTISSPSPDRTGDHGEPGGRGDEGRDPRTARSTSVMDAVGGARVTIDHPGPCSVALGVSGEIDMLTVGALSDCLNAAVALPGHRELLVDLSGVSFLGAAGIAAFAQARSRATEHATTMHLVAVSRVARRVLDLAGALGPTGAGGCFDVSSTLPG